MEGPKRVGRRNFLKGGAVAGAGAAAMTMLTGAGFQSPAAQASPLPETWDLETDVVIVGSGGAGLAAAVEAGDAGSEVIIVEKADHVGGLFISAGGQYIIGASHVQARMGIEDHLEWWYEDEVEAADFRVVPELIRTYVNMGPDTMLWLEERCGLQWFDIVTVNEGHRVDRGHRAAPGDNYPGGYPRSSGISSVVVMQRAAEEQGAQILLKHKMTQVYREANGPVVGIEVDNEGTMLNIKARKAVILAAGGYADNAQLCMSWDPRLGPDIYPDGGGAPSVGPYNECTGDALKAALEVGGSLTDMSFVSFLPIKWGSKVYWWWEPRDWTQLPEFGPGSTGLSISRDGFQRVILVRGNGQRYINEAEGAVPYNAEHPEQPFTAAYINLPERPRNVWAVTDAIGAAELGWDPEVIANADPLVYPALYPDAVAMADSLTELAEQMGVDVEGFIAEVGRYNDMAKDGVDEDFGKPKPLYTITQGPFFALKLCMLRHTQPGGMRINTKAQVIDRNGLWMDEPMSIDEEPVIPRLYGAGECAGYMGWRRPHGKLGNIVSFGRIAGMNAAAEEPLE